MTVTYPHDRPMPDGDRFEAPRDEPFVPVYARTRRSSRSRKGGVKTWMILAPIGVLMLGGAAAALVMADREAAAPAPLAEPAVAGPVLPAQPLAGEAEPVDAPAAAIEVTPEPAARPAPAPAARRASPAPARRTAPAAAPATREAPAEPAGAQPYTSSLNTTPPAAAATPAPAPAAPPVIVIQPAG